MGKNVATKLIDAHLLAGEATPGEEIALRIDQTLTQDATGTLVMLELEAMELERVRTELSVQYVDHNLVQEDFKNPDDHLFLLSACRRFGVVFSPPGSGVSHPVHMEHFGKPGKTMLGSDSHTPAAGALGMLAMGAGGIEVAMAMAGEPYHLKMPAIWGVELTGELPPWVSAKDVILEMLRRHGVRGGRDRIIEYYGDGVRGLDVWDRHVIANMGAELGATTTVFAADEVVGEFLLHQRRAGDYVELVADHDATYDLTERIDLAKLEPLIAKPSSPGNVVPVREVAGEPIYQAYVGSSANPGFRDFAICALMVKGRTVAEGVSFDINPASRDVLEDLIREGHMTQLIHAGARLHQVGCNGCIGMGQAPATGRNSLRTVPRNFPGRSGTVEDSVWLCSPETATASALNGVITDPRSLGVRHQRPRRPKRLTVNLQTFVSPPPLREAARVALVKGPNIVSLPEVEPIADDFEVPVLLGLGDDISTDEIMPAGSRVLPLRSNVPEISRFCFAVVDDTYPERARAVRATGHAIVAGENYGQGSSREHAAIAPRYLGLRVVLAKSFARIHWQNLVAFGVLPVMFERPEDHARIGRGDTLGFSGLHRALARGDRIAVRHESGVIHARHELSPRQVELLLAGSLVNWVRRAAE